LKPEMRKLVRNGHTGLPVSDFKSALQEIAHSFGLPAPSYVLIGTRGPDHRKIFTVEVRVASDPGYVARADGPTKKAAEQMAAGKALRHLQNLAEEANRDQSKPVVEV